MKLDHLLLTIPVGLFPIEQHPSFPFPLPYTKRAGYRYPIQIQNNHIDPSTGTAQMMADASLYACRLETSDGIIAKPLHTIVARSCDVIHHVSANNESAALVSDIPRLRFCLFALAFSVPTPNGSIEMNLKTLCEWIWTLATAAILLLAHHHGPVAAVNGSSLNITIYLPQHFVRANTASNTSPQNRWR